MNITSSKDCLGLRLRVSGLHQNWKWLHQTQTLHEYLISVTSTHTAAIDKDQDQGHHRHHLHHSSSSSSLSNRMQE